MPARAYPDLDILIPDTLPDDPYGEDGWTVPGLWCYRRDDVPLCRLWPHMARGRREDRMLDAAPHPRWTVDPTGDPEFRIS